MNVTSEGGVGEGGGLRGVVVVIWCRVTKYIDDEKSKDYCKADTT